MNQETPTAPTTPPPPAVTVDVLRRVVEKKMVGQTASPVYARLEVDWDLPYDIGGVWVKVGPTREKWPVQRLFKACEVREKAITLEKEDPYLGGYEPEIWKETDWRLAELRCTFPGEPIVLGGLGGNGAGKSHYFGKRFAMCMAENGGWYCIQLAFDQSGSRKVPQTIVHDYLPKELRPESGKLKKTANTKLSWNGVNGWTDDTFGLENGSSAEFKFYGGGDIKSMEGLRPDFVWADEMVPLEWVRAADRRLVTKSEQSRAIIPQLKEALAARARGEVDAWEKYLRPILAKLFQGVCAVSFTPAKGYNQTIGMLTAGAKILWEVEAELLPLTRDGEIIGHEKVPRVLYNAKERAVTMFFHISDNRHGGNWEAQQKRLAGQSRSEKLWQAYGVATKMAGVQFPLFKQAAHVRPLSFLPGRGCWFHVVDPCNGRNWFMQWWKVAPNPMGRPLLFCAREWPQPNDYIVAGDVGNPGEWATLEPRAAQGNSKKASVREDGERGPAQQCWGLGFRQMADEIERVERELWELERKLHGNAAAHGENGRILVQDGCRIMDSRSYSSETQNQGGSVTLAQTMAQYELFFCKAGRDSGAEAGKSVIKEGVDMINDRLFYNQQMAVLDPKTGLYVFHGQSPSMVYAENCENSIFCMGNWTGRDGGEGATKDPVDVTRYLTIADPQPLEPEDLEPWGGGSY